MKVQYRVIVLVLALMLALCACSSEDPIQSVQTEPTEPTHGASAQTEAVQPTDTQTQQINGIEGVYEGDVDSGGKRSGYGIWRYGNYEYQGKWKSDRPNGEGVLYELNARPENAPEGSSYIMERITQAVFTDGIADGSAEYSIILDNGTAHTFLIEIENGHALENKTAACEECEVTVGRPDGKAMKIGWVPPFADMKIGNSSGMTFIYDIPKHGGLSDDSLSAAVYDFIDEPLPPAPVSLMVNRYSSLSEKCVFFEGQLYSIDEKSNLIRINTNSGERSEPLANAEPGSRVYLYQGAIYFIAREGGIYRMSVEGGDIDKLIENDIHGMSILHMDNNFMYYSLKTPKEVWRIRLDGSGSEAVLHGIENTQREIIGSDEEIVVFADSNNAQNGTCDLVSYSISSQIETVIAKEVIPLVQIGKFIFYLRTETKGPDCHRSYLHRVHVDGTDNTALLEEDESVVGAESGISFVGNAIYITIAKYANASDLDQNFISKCTARMDFDAMNRTEISKDKIKIVSSGGRLYYAKESQIGIIGVKEKLITLVSAQNTRAIFSIVDGWIYYFSDSGDNAKLNRIRVDGTENMIVYSMKPAAATTP